MVSLRLEPAESVFVVFRRPSSGDSLARVVRRGPGTPPAPEEKIEILLARYEARDGSRGADVTDRVRQLVAEGQIEIPATNDVFGDPVPLVVKRLRIEWRLDGKPRTETVDEGGTIQLSTRTRMPAELEWTLRKEGRRRILIPWKPGVYELTMASGKTQRLTVPRGAQALPLEGSWTVRFDPKWGGPAETVFPKLISWSEHEQDGIRYYSGSATYVKEFTLPPSLAAAEREILLDLGMVKNFAEVTLNGRSLGVLWKAPFRVAVTGLVRPGKNVLTIRVTNLWPNRLIGDEHKPPEVQWRGNALAAWPEWVWSGKPRPKSERYTFTTWRFWSKDDPLLESGLLGPVVLRSAQRIPLKQ